MQTIRTYSNLFEAQSAKAVLEKDGIRVFLKGENVASLNLFYIRALNQIDLQVDERDVSSALKLIGAERDCHDEVEKSSREIRRAFKYAVPVGIAVGIAYAVCMRDNSDALLIAPFIAMFATVFAMIAISWLFKEKEYSTD